MNRHVDRAIATELGAVEIDLNDLGSFVPRRSAAVVDSEVERRAQHEDEIRLREREPSRPTEEERMRVRKRAARHSVQEPRRTEALEQRSRALSLRRPAKL